VVFVVDISQLSGDVSIDTLPSVTTFNSAEPFSRLGWQVGFTDTFFWISSPYKNNPQGIQIGADSGAFYVFRTGKEFPIGIVHNSEQQSNFCFASTKAQSLYSFSVTFLDFNGDNEIDLLLGAPRDHSVFENSGSAGLFLSWPPTQISSGRSK